MFGRGALSEAVTSGATNPVSRSRMQPIGAHADSAVKRIQIERRGRPDIAGKAGGPSWCEKPAVLLVALPEARGAEQLDDGTPSSCGQMHDQQDDADDEENPGDLRSDRRDAGSPENTSNQPNHQKHESVIQHSNTSLSQPNKAERVPFWFVLNNQSLEGSQPERRVVERCIRSVQSQVAI